MIDDIELPPFDRRHCGPRNEYIVRRHISLPEAAAKAIQRREHPAWSSQRVSYEVAA